MGVARRPPSPAYRRGSSASPSPASCPTRSTCPPSTAWRCGRRVMTAGEKYGITPYGTETMHVLRAEKGFIIVGQETDGTVTPHDLGMDWIVSKKQKDFIGRARSPAPDMLKRRPQATGRPARPRTRRSAAGRRAIGGACPGEAAHAHDRPCDLQLLQPESGPLDRAGPGQGRSGPQGHKILRARWQTARVIPCTVTDPVFLDPEGERLRE